MKGMDASGQGKPDQEKVGYGQSDKQLDATLLCFGCSWSSHLSLGLEDPSLSESLAISLKGQQLRDWLVNHHCPSPGNGGPLPRAALCYQQIPRHPAFWGFILTAQVPGVKQC